MIRKVFSFLPKTRVSNPVSKLIRPLFEKKRLKSVLGGLLSATTLLSSALWVPVGAYEGISTQSFVPNAEISVETKKSAFLVVPEMRGVSQRYNRWHPGADITAHPGDSVYPVESGTVVRVLNFRWGYGRHLIVDHGNGLTSLYAHMGKILVDEGDVVDSKTAIAEVGLTGRTTGYHLHLEIKKNDRNVNPFAYLRRG